MSDKVYGIDLGTTYSAVAMISDIGMAEIVKNFVGEDTTPSVVYFNDDGTVDIGSQAKQTQVSDPDNACSLIKRLFAFWGVGGGVGMGSGPAR